MGTSEAGVGGGAGPGFYARLVGPAWAEVHEVVRRFHGHEAVWVGTGTFRVVHGENWIARLLARVLGLPAPSESCPVRLEVTRTGVGERWARTFGETRLVSTQAAGAEGLLLERFGAFEVRLRVEVQGGGLRYHQEASGLRCGRLFLRLPRWASPRIVASEDPVDESGRVSVSVTVSAPWIGRVIRYEGVLAGEDGAP
jgi:hypothetical protein